MRGIEYYQRRATTFVQSGERTGYPRHTEMPIQIAPKRAFYRNVPSESSRRGEKNPVADVHLPRPGIPACIYMNAVLQVRARIKCKRATARGTRFTLPFNREPRTRSVASASSYLLPAAVMKDGSHIKLAIHVIVITCNALHRAYRTAP